MRLVLLCSAAILAAGITAADASAQYYYPAPQYYGCPTYPAAPDMCGPYFYCTNGYAWYGPSYNVYPPFAPVGGVGVPLNAYQPNNTAFPMNPYTRSPRDYFMWSEAQKMPSTRETRPPFVP